MYCTHSVGDGQAADSSPRTSAGRRARGGVQGRARESVLLAGTMQALLPAADKDNNDDDDDDDEYMCAAQAVDAQRAKNVPNIQHLSLVGSL